MLDRLEREGVVIRSGVNVVRIERAGGAVRVVLQRRMAGEESIEGTHLLIATGRRPTLDGLDLEAARIKHDRAGIVVNKKLKTSNRRVYAIGDVAAGQLQFTHAANYHAGLVIRNALFRLPVKANNDLIPWVTFTEPELAQAGLTEAQARERGIKIRILRWPYHDNDRAQAERETRGHIKVVVKTNGKILGASIVGAQAGELIATWTLAIAQGLNIRAFTGIVLPYPTLAEIGKRAAIDFFTPSLTSPWVRRIIAWLANFRLRRNWIPGTDIDSNCRARRAARAAAHRPVRQAAAAHRPVRDAGGSPDLRALDRQFPSQLAQRPAGRRAHRRAGARRRAERHGAGQPRQANPQEHRRPRGGDEDGNAAPPARRHRHPGDDRAGHRHALGVVVARDHRRLRHAAVCQPDDVMRVVGPAPMGGEFLEIVLDEAPLRKAMLNFSVNILLLSLLISGITAMLVFFTLHYLLVRPMRRITENMIAFRADPENPARVIGDSGRRDEVGTTERELAAMQREIASMLHQKSRLAALGLAVSKINHDLRNLWRRRNCFPISWRTCPIRRCSASRPS